MLCRILKIFPSLELIESARVGWRSFPVNFTTITELKFSAVHTFDTARAVLHHFFSESRVFMLDTINILVYVMCIAFQGSCLPDYIKTIDFSKTPELANM